MPDLIQKLGLSRYAVQQLEARPAWRAELADPAPFPPEEMRAALDGARAMDEPAFKRALRELRQRVLLRTMARDLSGRADLAEVCDQMSTLAELEIQAALDWIGEPELVVVGMGKLGGRELNVSSDVDL